MIKLDKKIMVHAYKRNGWFYRAWEFPKVVDADNNFVCVSLKNSIVITSDKDSDRNFKSRSLKNSFWFFFKNEWFNIVATLSETDEVHYYVNIASPFIYEEEAIKYYDLDLDIKMRSNVKDYFRILDTDEFEENQTLFNYEGQIIDKALETLERFKNEEFRNKIISKINVNVLKSYMKEKE